ncbi:MAG: hypothetical protein WCT77_00870 [Bacteroidota bacterium]|jgi:hypothetical protein
MSIGKKIINPTTITELKKGFDEEFKLIKHFFIIRKLKFEIPYQFNNKTRKNEIKVIEATEFDSNLSLKEEQLALPGVYVFGYKDEKPREILRIGRNLDNSLKRAKEVFLGFYFIMNDNKGKMQEWYEDDNSMLYFFQLKEEYRKNKLHWVKALECYLIYKYNSTVPSGRA